MNPGPDPERKPRLLFMSPELGKTRGMGWVHYFAQKYKICIINNNKKFKKKNTIFLSRRTGPEK